MYLNADSLPDRGMPDDYDICIVGAGAAGIAMARRLVGAPVRVLLLSSGAPSDRGRPLPQRQAIYRGTVGPLLEKVDPIFLDRSRLHMHGGTTNHFGFWARPLDPVDFRSRPGYRDAAWPFGLDELTPYYRDAHHFGHFGPFNYDDLPFWERVLFASGFPQERGDALQPAIMHAQYEETLHDFQVQFDADLRAAENVTVLFNACLLQVTTNSARDHVTGLQCASIEQGKPGRTFTVRARSYALAMGGIENVRALLLSGGLGDNRSGHLGQGFMVHPLVTSAAKVRFASAQAADVRGFFRDQQVRLEPTSSGEEPYRHVSMPLVNPEDVAGYCMFNAWGVLVPTEHALDAERIGNFRIILRFTPQGDEAVININWEQIPNEESRITLNPARTDPVFGQPVTHLNWQMLMADKRTLARGLELVEGFLRRKGAVDFRLLTEVGGGADAWTFPPEEGALATGDHHMGALRMARHAEDGVVDANSRVHTVDNLYIAGCGVFPTGGFANPTLTIVALALRLADHMREQAAR